MFRYNYQKRKGVSRLFGISFNVANETRLYIYIFVILIDKFVW